MFIHFQNATCGHAISNKELEIRKQYLIHKIDKVKTKYGISVLATIKLDTSVTRVFFPRSYVQTFTERNIMDINPSSVRVCLIYHGTCRRSSTGGCGKSYLFQSHRQCLYNVFGKKKFLFFGTFIISIRKLCVFIYFPLIISQYTIITTDGVVVRRPRFGNLFRSYFLKKMFF